MTASIALARLGVFRGSNVLYDQKFHMGVNIIHGANGSGKSTLADFIFFALGGDLKEWREYAGMAGYVMAEVVAGTTTLTLRRDVTEDGTRPMAIFFGSMELALLAGPTQWETFPYSRPKAGYNFSQVLFRAIGLPESISEGGSNVTMHQILRLLYSDQLSPIQRIFRVETFDPWQTRQAVGDLLCGVGGYDLFEKQIALRAIDARYSEVSLRLRNLHTVAATYGKDILIELITIAIKNTILERDALSKELASTLESEGDIPNKDVERMRLVSRRELGRARRAVVQLENDEETLMYEIQDADAFLIHLTAALTDFDDASATFFSLGIARFEFCPACFTPTGEGGDHEVCHLCGSEAPKVGSDSKALAVRLDLEMQLKESTQLQDDRREQLASLTNDLRIARATLKRLDSLDEVVRRSENSTRDTKVAELSRKIGFLDRDLESLHQRLQLSKEIAAVSDEKAKLNEDISLLKSQIETITAGQAKRKAIAYTRISEVAKRFLSGDLSDQSDFGVVENVSFDFAGDWIAINGNKNRAGSASGMVILKNSFLMGLLIGSLEDTAFNLPRFMLMDNIEDKGMIQERSWNFQRLVINESKKHSMNHQIIFTTSKIAPELDGSPFVVGRKYTHDNPCLEFATPKA